MSGPLSYLRFPLGWMPDPQDPRDLPASDKLGSGPVPASADNDALVPEILQQGPINSCVANAAMLAIRASHIKQGAAAAPLGSRLFAYYVSRASHGWQRRDEGTYIRSCFSALNKLGFPAEDAWPYDTKRVNRQPGFKAIQRAMDQRKPTVYTRIYEAGSARVDMVKRALAAGNLVVFGTDIDATFYSVREEVKGPPTEQIIGGHAMTLIGYTGDVFEVANSWGEDWGVKGRFSMSAEWVRWNGTRDLWIVEQAPIFSEVKR